ncbi:Heterogeneous nuclear ribonucleoprotein L-like [Liparis tanakae]|uniref:Heterogeneous nuclear ribonucleoprotein L-like n=1 Tax=Liparis tanakae TaxID=230148 RepID=A0A4Z2GCK7_9TELE|nr:Heterogeneous nuclear ribonucleoprotein L-like [Liparis tanakae]
MSDDNGDDSHRISPSPVVHVRGLCEAVVEADLIDALEKFGSICSDRDIVDMSKRDRCPWRCGLVKSSDTWKDQGVNFHRGKGRQRQAILGEHPSSYSDNGYGSPCPLLPLPGNSRYKLSSADVPDMVSYPLPQSSSSYSAHTPSSVAMVSGLHSSKMNCTRIFNLFCLYGNIEKVKFMKSVPGTALVEMGDEYAVDRAITHLNSIKVFGKRLNLCTEHDVPGFVKFKMFDAKPSSKTISGLLEFDNGSNPYTLKLCFSTSSHL